MHLCMNRPEGFGPKSTLSSPIPTSCFVDTILLPLPIWLGLLLLPLLTLLTLRLRKTHFDPSTAHLRTPALPPGKLCGYTSTASLYYALIVANILMQTLEIVRLALLDYGIGLLPFAYVGLVTGAVLHWTAGAKGKVRYWQAVNGIFWLGGVVMCVVQVIGLSNEGIDGRKGSKYPVSDQVIDVAVMAGVYAVVAILEVVLGVWRAKRRRSGERRVKIESPVGERGEFIMGGTDAYVMHGQA